MSQSQLPTQSQRQLPTQSQRQLPIQSQSQSQPKLQPVKKKWYEDDDLIVTENENANENANAKVLQRQSKFGPGVIGTEFNAIKVKLQEMYEIGILKLFIETEVLKSGSGSFEPGLKELYNPYIMTKPLRYGIKDLLFTSDIEFSELGFLPGSLQDDRRKYFLNRFEFNKYLLRLPRPISDIETPLGFKEKEKEKEKIDSNAYKCLQVLGSEESKIILMICDDFKRHNDEKERQNTNAIIKLQKELDNAKKLVVDAKITQVEKAKLEDVERKLTNEKNKKIKLETKYKNYKAACKILSSVGRRMQYDATLVKSYPVTIKDGNSLSTTIVDWLKYKQKKSPNFFKEVLAIFKPTLSIKVQTNKDLISNKIDEVVRSLSSMFQPIIESYFYSKLNNFILYLPGNTKQDDIQFLHDVVIMTNRTNDPTKYSWKNINSVLERVSKLISNTDDTYETAKKLYFVSKFMENFQSMLLRVFTFNKKDGGIENMIEEIKTSESALNTMDVVNMLYNNIVYLKTILNKIMEATKKALPRRSTAALDALTLELANLIPPPEQTVEEFLQRLTELIQLVDALEISVREFRLTIETNSYKTILGEASHAAFVESIFSEESPQISHANRNNKFLVVSDFITDAYDNDNVVITIPDDYYDLETLGSAIEKELCKKCKWRVDAVVPNQNRDMIWICKYDENKKIQLKLYFPENDLMKANNIIPNIHDAIISRGIVVDANNTFRLEIGGYTTEAKILSIPQGEYKDIQHLLEVMAKTINDFIGKVSSYVSPAYKVKMVITLDDVNKHVKFEFKSKAMYNDETLFVTVLPGLATILGSTTTTLLKFNTRNQSGGVNEIIMASVPNFPAASKSVEIKTRMQIDGDEYDASTMFGVPSSVAPEGVITITPEITIRELALRKNNNNQNKFKVNEMVNDYLGFSRLPPPDVSVERISDYGILNFTGGMGFRITVEVAGPVQPAAITTLDAVDLSKIVSSKANNSDNSAKLKTELMEKTGLYINNSLLHAKVPVITYTDVLNSLFYRYPCIPSDNILEGTPEFDKFIEERVNVSKFKEVVWLGKGINDTSEPLSLTIRKALDKTLMYDDCDEERSKLMCDLHYAICGPVFSNTLFKQEKQYGEIDELEMFHQFQLEIKRPDILAPGDTQPRPIVKPFTVKGITPYYDVENKRYKYFIYGHYFDFMDNQQVGCVKYYDPGSKIGPQPMSLQLYDILLFTHHDAGKQATVNSLVEVNYNNNDESFVYPVFTIAGTFDKIKQLDSFGVEIFNKDDHNIVVWTPGKMNTGLPFANLVGVYSNNPEVNDEIRYRISNSQLKSNSFGIFWNIMTGKVDIDTTFPLVYAALFNFDDDDDSIVSMFILNVYIKRCRQCIILKSNVNDDDTMIFLPYIDRGGNENRNQILITQIQTQTRLKISCGAVSINKDVFNITKKIHFYQREYIVVSSSTRSVKHLKAIQNKIDELRMSLNNNIPQQNGLKNVNPRIENNMLWIGLKEQCVDDTTGRVERKILSCSIIQYLDTDVEPVLKDVILPVTFLSGDFIEKIKIDINDPEIVIVFGKFTATIQERIDETKVKTIQNVMVIYTNLGTKYNNNKNYGNIQSYSLTYDNFQSLTINNLPEFRGYYSCVDGLVVASYSGGTMQQNMGTLLVTKSEAEKTPVVIGFHGHKITGLTIDEQYNNESDIWSSILCYDYKMSADTIEYQWNASTSTGTEVIDKGLFNPLSFNAFKTTFNDDVVVSFSGFAPNYDYITNQQIITELFNGEFVLVSSKQSRPMTSALSKLHVLNTWGIDLSDDSTPFYKRIKELSEGEGVVNMKIYEMYINKVVDSIIGSAKKYYEDKIKNSLYDEDNGVNTSSTPVVKGGGRREDAAAMIVAKQVELEEMKKLQRYNKNKESREIKSTIEIRVPDIMMSDAYLDALSDEDKDKARKYFFDALYKYSKKVEEIASNQESENNSKVNKEGGDIVINDIYKVVLCLSNLQKYNFNKMYDKKKIVDKGITSVLSLSPDLYDYDLDDVEDGIKNVILVNEWNDRGFIGDYGAFSRDTLTPNQTIVSKTMTPAVNQVVEFIPKIANSSFLLNPFITYGSFDSSRWTGINSLYDKEAVGVQVGGTYEEDQLRMYQQQLRREREQQQFQNAYGLSSRYEERYDPRYDPRYEQRYEQRYEDERRQVLEKTNISSSELTEDRAKMVRPNPLLKRVVLWLYDFREGKMLMLRSVGPTSIMLSLPTQKKITGAENASGDALLKELCRKYFQTEAVLKRWTLQHAYIYASSGTGIFIYNAKTNDLPKETMKMVYVSMNAIYKVATATSIKESKNDGKEISIIDSDKPIIVEIFKVVKLISGGIISTTSKEFNEVLARLRSKTVPPHLRSIISVTKRTKIIEANINFLIKLFFSPNNLFFLRGNYPYYIYSSQRSCKTFNMIKQETYDDDSYLTCLKLFLQTETDFKNKNKDSANNFRVGCAVKKKLITDNFSAVWDNFWGDLIESEEESKLDEQLAEDVGEKGTEEGKKSEGDGEGDGEGEGEEGEGDKESPTICLQLATQSGVAVYGLASSRKVSTYFPINYNDVYYNIRANEQYRFNNEFFYDLHLDLDRDNFIEEEGEDDRYLGFVCMAYYKNKNKNNPLLFLGDIRGRVHKLELNTHKLTKFIETNEDGSVMCMDILDVEGQVGYMLVGGKFTEITTFKDVNVEVQSVETALPVVLINLSTYEIILLYDSLGLPPTTTATTDDATVEKVCICKTKKVVRAKGGALNEDVEGYIAVIGGTFEMDIPNYYSAAPPAAPVEKIENIGCVLIRKNLNNMEARLVAVDSKVATNPASRSGITNNNSVDDFKLTSIICQENEENDKVDKTKTVFFIGGRFDTCQAVDYVAYKAAKAAGPAGPAGPAYVDTIDCNGIIKLTLECEYDKDDTVSKYNQASVIERIVVNTPRDCAGEIIKASLQYGIINSKKYLFCLTEFFHDTYNSVTVVLNVYDIGSKSNILQMKMPEPIPEIEKENYVHQTLLLTKDDKQSVLIMSFTQQNEFLSYTYTCNVSSLNKGAAAPRIIAAASNEINYIDKTNVITDMFYHKDTGEVFIAHMGPRVTSEYPLTVRSNYQEIGEWKLKSASTEDASELDKFNKFMDKVFEIRKIFELNPSMILFLQDVDFRDYDGIDSKISKTRLNKMRQDLIAALDHYSVYLTLRYIDDNIINMDSPCNNIDKKIKNIMNFVDAFKNPGVELNLDYDHDEDNTEKKMYNFVNDLLFMLVYAGCNDLAELICNDYVNLVIAPAPPPPRRAVPASTWKSRFGAVLSRNKPIKELIDNIGKKGKSNLTPDTLYNFKICSDPITHTGVSYLEYNYNQNLNSTITSKNQNNLKKRIYESEKDSFFSSNGQFHINNTTDNLGTTMEQIKFCSFYKFKRLRTAREEGDPVEFGNIGNEDLYTVYVSVDIEGDDGIKIKSSQVFDFLNIIRENFMSFDIGTTPNLDIGISGRIKRIMFGGDFGCNLLNDVEVCKKFKSKQMKIYTTMGNSVIDGSDGNTNQIFMIDVDLEQAVQVGGGNNNNQKRICIGERIEENHRVLSNKRKTRRKLPLMLSSS